MWLVPNTYPRRDKKMELYIESGLSRAGRACGQPDSVRSRILIASVVLDRDLRCALSQTSLLKRIPVWQYLGYKLLKGVSDPRRPTHEIHRLSPGAGVLRGLWNTRELCVTNMNIDLRLINNGIMPIT